MLSRLVEASLRYKFLVLITFLVVAALGVRSFNVVPIDAFPDVTPAQVNIYTESPGLAAEDVEQLLTFPIESAMAAQYTNMSVSNVRCGRGSYGTARVDIIATCLR